jgi:diacylglycerol kinase family enzyme
MDIFLFNELSRGFKVKKINKMMKKWSKKHKSTTFGVSLIDLEIDKFFERLKSDDRLVVVGGDGTLHYFVNYINNIEVKNDIFYIPNGTGNDFYKSIKKEIKKPVNKYLLNLPTVEFNDKKLYFLNGCGTGLDGYVCSLVNICEKKGKLSFFKCTYKGFRKYKRTDITVTVDGKEIEFKRVFLASIMNGNVEGGGMKMTPKAKRLDEYIDICIIHKLSKFSLILCFPLIYLGKHTIKRKAVTILSGKEISIKCEEGMYMQVDGEDFTDIKEIHAKR